MKFLVDECTGMSVVVYLRDAGYDVLEVAGYMPQATDAEILRCAVNEDRIVVTNDKDFGEMVFRGGRAHRGVILLRLHDERGENKVRVLSNVLAQIGDRLPDCYVVATEIGFRIR